MATQKSLTWKDSFDLVSPKVYANLADLNFKADFKDFDEFFSNTFITLSSSSKLVNVVVRFNESQICGFFSLRLVEIPAPGLKKNFPHSLPLRVWWIERLCKNNNLSVSGIDKMGKFLLAIALNVIKELDRSQVAIIKPGKLSKDIVNDFKKFGFKQVIPGFNDWLYFKLC